MGKFLQKTTRYPAGWCEARLTTKTPRAEGQEPTFRTIREFLFEPLKLLHLMKHVEC